MSKVAEYDEDTHGMPRSKLFLWFVVAWGIWNMWMLATEGRPVCKGPAPYRVEHPSCAELYARQAKEGKR